MTAVGILSKTSAVPDPTLPAGYDDPASDFYVPEELRPFWAESGEAVRARGGIDLERAKVGLAHERAYAKQHEAWERGAAGWRNSARDGTFRLDKTEHAAYTVRDELSALSLADEASLVQRLTFAMTHAQAEHLATLAASTAADSAAAAKKRTCAICGKVGEFKGEVIPRDTRRYRAGTIGKPSTELLSCIDCFDVLMAVTAERAGTQKVDGKSRRALAEAWIAKAWIAKRAK